MLRLDEILQLSQIRESKLQKDLQTVLKGGKLVSILDYFN